MKDTAFFRFRRLPLAKPPCILYTILIGTTHEEAKYDLSSRANPL